MKITSVVHRQLEGIFALLLMLTCVPLAQAGGTLTLISNPTPVNGDLFGISVAAVGTDKVLVGAPGDDTEGENAGAAYLFDLSGTLLHTYFSAEAAPGENFGFNVIAVGTDKVLISTSAGFLDEITPVMAGRSYLFDLAGNHLGTFTNPSPTIGDQFGIAADMGNDTIVIGSSGDDADATNAGKMYQYDLNTVAPVPPGTIAGTVQYTGALGPGTLMVGAYASAVPVDLNNSEVDWTAIIGNPGSFSIEVEPGTYYPVVFYDLDGNLQPDAGEPYLYYDNSATTPITSVSVASSATVNLNAQTVTDASLLDGFSGGTATYTGIQNGGVVDFDHAIWVEVYSDDQLTSPFSANPAFSNGADYRIATYAGTYYLRAWFDANGNELFDNGEPVEIYSNKGVTPGDPVVVSGVTVLNLSFDDTFLNPAGLEGDPDPSAPVSPAPDQMFSDPTVAAGDWFGFPVAALDADRFVAGAAGANANAGEYHVYDITTGLLVQTLQHTDSTFALVTSVSSFGPDHVLAGSEEKTVSGFLLAGSAFLFEIATGNVILTIENPAPEEDDAFGIAVAALGTGRIAIGADLDNPGGIFEAGTVYIFDSAGVLLDTINEPVPAAGDEFGYALSPIGTEALIIGAPSGDALDNFTGPGEAWVLTDLCPADSDNSGSVNVVDLLDLLGKWGTCTAFCPEDNDGNGTVNVVDLLALLGAWGPCPP